MEDKEVSDLALTCSYFLGINFTEFLELPIGKVYDIIESINKQEEQFGIIAKKVDEYKIQQKSKQLTVTPENADLVMDQVKSVVDTYESAAKQRKL